MHTPQIHVTRRGLRIKARAADFPALAPLADFIDLQPLGLAENAVKRLESVEVVGRAA